MADCPFCEYESSSSSVEAHVSGSTDDAHQGKLGSNYRAIIGSSVGESSEPDAKAEDPESDLPPGLALAAATAILAIIVIAGPSGSGGSVEEPEDVEESAGWA